MATDTPSDSDIKPKPPRVRKLATAAADKPAKAVRKSAGAKPARKPAARAAAPKPAAGRLAAARTLTGDAAERIKDVASSAAKAARTPRGAAVGAAAAVGLIAGLAATVGRKQIVKAAGEVKAAVKARIAPDADGDDTA